MAKQIPKKHKIFSFFSLSEREKKKNHQVVQFHHNKRKQGVYHTVALPFTLKSILRQKKKNYENPNISSCKNILILKKSSKRNQNPSRHYNSII
jgi:hypothetical protein